MKPEIEQLEFNPPRIAQGKTYTITVKLSKRSCPIENVEFSTDSTHWQSSPVFTKLDAGEYTIYARRKEKNLHDLYTKKEIVLQEAPNKKCVTVDELNSLIEKMAYGEGDASDKAADKFLRLVGNNTTVIGVDKVRSASDMETDIVSGGSVYTVVEIDCEDGVLNSITIK